MNDKSESLNTATLPNIMQWKLIEVHFYKVLDLQLTERKRYLQKLSHSNTDIASSVIDLLTSHFESEDSLEKSIFDELWIRSTEIWHSVLSPCSPTHFDYYLESSKKPRKNLIQYILCIKGIYHQIFHWIITLSPVEGTPAPSRDWRWW